MSTSEPKRRRPKWFADLNSAHNSYSETLWVGWSEVIVIKKSFLKTIGCKSAGSRKRGFEKWKTEL